MNAKEIEKLAIEAAKEMFSPYREGNVVHTSYECGFVDGFNTSQAKSKEEAERRIELVEGWWEQNVDGEMNITVKKVVNLAAFGKEGEG